MKGLFLAPSCWKILWIFRDVPQQLGALVPVRGVQSLIPELLAASRDTQLLWDAQDRDGTGSWMLTGRQRMEPGSRWMRSNRQSWEHREFQLNVRENFTAQARLGRVSWSSGDGSGVGIRGVVAFPSKSLFPREGFRQALFH